MNPTLLHVPRSLAKLISRLRGPKEKAFVAIRARRIQAIEDAVTAALAQWSIDAGNKYTLRTFGRILGRSQGDLSLDLFRMVLRAQALVNRSTGRLDELLEILRTATAFDDGYVFYSTEYQPATIDIEVQGPFVSGLGDVLWSLLRKAKPAGVRLFFTVDTATDFLLFDTLAASQDPNSYGTLDPPHGWESLDETTGGVFARVYDS